MIRLEVPLPPGGESVPVDIGYASEEDPRTLEVHVGAPGTFAGARLFVGGQPGEGGLEIALVQEEPGWYRAGSPWNELCESHTLFGRVMLHLEIGEGGFADVEIEVPVAPGVKRLIDGIRQEFAERPELRASIVELGGLARTRLLGSDELAICEWMKRLLDRARQAAQHIEMMPIMGRRAEVQRSCRARPWPRMLRYLPLALRSGQIGRSTDGRGVPLRIPDVRQVPDANHPANRAARRVIEDVVGETRRLARTIRERSERLQRDPFARHDPFRQRRLERLDHASRMLDRDAHRSSRSMRPPALLGRVSPAGFTSFPVLLPARSGYSEMRLVEVDLRTWRSGALQAQSLLQRLEREEVDAPGLARLYEWWVGVRMIDALLACGLIPRTERAPYDQLRAGGRLLFADAGETREVELLVEPAFSAQSVPIPGVVCAPPTRGDPRRMLAPDLVLYRRNPERLRCLLVLDASTSHNPDVLQSKGLYRRRLVREAGLRVLGAPRPLEAVLSSLAVHPGHGHQVESSDPLMREGILPLRPASAEQTQLLKEVVQRFVQEDGTLVP
ncbi:MAG: hypothetical protein AB1486_01740 [Planctomycetota bacterium]